MEKPLPFPVLAAADRDARIQRAHRLRAEAFRDMVRGLVRVVGRAAR